MKTTTLPKFTFLIAIILNISFLKINAQALTFQPNPVDMGNVEVNQPSEAFINVSDSDPTTAPNAISITNLYFTNDTENAFQTGNYFYNSGAGMGNIGIIVQPTTVGTIYTATLNVEVNETTGTQTYQIPVTATAVPATFPEISVSNLSFTAIQVNTTASENLEIFNIGNENLEIFSFNIDTATDDSFSITAPTTPLTITPGNSITVPVTFAPTPLVGGNGIDEFNRATTITINSNDFFDSTTEVALSGTIFESNPQSTDTNYGNVEVGQTVTQNNTVTNNGQGILFIDDIRIEAYPVGNNATADFNITNMPSLPLELAQGESLVLNIEFTPGDVGFRRASLYYDVRNHTGEAIPVTLEGVGIQSEIDFATELNLGNIRVGENISQTFTISNPGTLDTQVSALEISGANVSNFNITDASAQTIPAGGSVDYEINFNSDTIGGKVAQISFTSNVDSSPHSISLLANGTNSALSVSPADLAFPEVLVGETSAPMTVTLSNEFGSDAVEIQNISIPNTSFSFSGISLPLTIAAGGSTTFNVTSSPEQLGNVFSPLVIESNDDNATIGIDLSGTGISPEIELGRTQIFFLNTPFDSNGRTELLTIKNNGTATLTINSANVVNNPGTFGAELPFEIANTVAFPLNILPDETGIIPVKFIPNNVGRYTGRLSLVTNDGNFGIFMSGSAIAPLANITKNGDFSSEIRIGETQTRTFTITNNGVGALEISAFELEELGVDADTEPDFSIDMELPFFVAEGQSRIVTITAAPLSSGNKNVMLNLTTNSATNAVTGDPLLWSYQVSELAYFEGSDPLEVTDTPLNNTSYTPYTITNTGTVTMVVYGDNLPLRQIGASFSIPDNADLPLEFSTFNNFPFTIDAGASAEILIAYTPTNSSAFGEIALRTGPILNNDAVGGFDYSKKITAYGGALIPEITVIDETPLNFVETSVGRSSERTLTIKNTGTTDLVINDIYGDQNFGFVDDATFETTTLEIGEEMTFDITFSPLNLGSVNGVVGFQANIPGTFFPINTTGIGIEPAEVDVNGLIFEADRTTSLGSGLVLLSGNVHAGKMEFGGDVTINLNTNAVNCQCRVFTTNITEVGEYGGEEVSLLEGDVKFKVELNTEGTAVINAALDSSVSSVSTFFSLVGIPIEFTKFELISGTDPGIEVGGSLDLPAEVFGPDVNVTIDRLRIVESGVNIEGSSSISGDPAIRILKTFELQQAGVNFNTFTNTFGGFASVKLALLGKTTSIDGSVSIVNGGLDSVGLEVEISPGIPLASTGWELSGGNGFINGIQIPPLSIGMGVDLKPITPIDILKLDNMQLAYTFGTSLEASGTIQVLGQDVGGGSILVNSLGVNVGAYVNLYDVFRGDVSLLVENRETRLFAEAEADMSLTIPEIPAADCSVCEPVNAFLPFTVAELQAKINNDRFKASTTIADVLNIDVGVEFGGDITVGGNLGLLSFGTGRGLPEGWYYENNETLRSQNRFEGSSLVVNARSSVTDIPFNLPQSYQNIIVRIEGDTAYPTATLTLPNGTVLDPTNASSNNALYTESNENQRVFYILKNTQIGNYTINASGANNFEIDVFGAEFAPEIEITSLNFNNTTKDLVINWNDEDLDSDAKISLYYDIDGKGANGSQIVTDISEDDAVNTFTFNALDLTSGTYHIYAKIEDDTNAAVYSYALDTFTVLNESPVETPILIGELVDNVFEMTWTPIENAEHYVMYIDNEAVTHFSSSRSVGNATAFDFTEIEPGRTYKFGVTAMREEADGSFTESNLSNTLEFVYTSPDKNNKPKIETEALPAITDPCATYSFDVILSDSDTEDILTLTMPTFPTGMTLSGSTITWKPTSDQIGKHQVILKVTDDKGGFEEKSFVITVFEADSAPKPDFMTLPEAIAECTITVSAPTATDDCDGVITATTLDPTTYSIPGTYNIIWNYEDATGNIAQQTQRVVITDTELPNAVCKTIDVTLDEMTNSVTIAPEDLNDGSSDNCAVVNELSYSISQDTFTSEGEYSVVLSVEDQAGNIATCNATVRVNAALSQNDFEPSINKVKIYPNPNYDGKLYLSIPSSISIIAIEIYDISGRKVLNTNQIDNYVDLRNISSGTYLLKLYSEDGTAIKRLIKK